MLTPGGVLDASFLLAFILGEISADEAEPWLAGACISAVNLSETVARLTDGGFTAEFISFRLDRMNLDVRTFDQGQAKEAGLLRPITRQLGLSFGDRACLALAAELGRPAVTADRAWAKLDLGIPIELIR
jgi:PIN domain nuclease of toxin-antitoxin system